MGAVVEEAAVEPVEVARVSSCSGTLQRQRTYALADCSYIVAVVACVVRRTVGNQVSSSQSRTVGLPGRTYSPRSSRRVSVSFSHRWASLRLANPPFHRQEPGEVLSPRS